MVCEYISDIQIKTTTNHTVGPEESGTHQNSVSYDPHTSNVTLLFIPEF